MTLFGFLGNSQNFGKFRVGVIGKTLTGYIGGRNDFIFGDIMEIRWAGGASGARTPIFCLNFFWRIFQNDHNFPDFFGFFIL